MDVKTVCLGMLTDGPASGYDMKKRFESCFGHFFPAGYGSIYPALANLAESGLVEFEEVPQDGKPDRKVYSITDKGRDALAQSLSNPSPAHKVRSEFLAMMCFAHLMSEAQIDTVLDNKLAEIDAFLSMMAEPCNPERRQMSSGARFVAGFGRHVTTSLRKYIEDNRDMLKQRHNEERKLASGS